MQSIKSTGTKPELYLRKLLANRSLRYRLNVKDLPGRPDIVFTKLKIAVFCDGDFWHGKNWKDGKPLKKIKVRAKYWNNKILGNIERDKKNTLALKAQGWTVLRYWESDIILNGENIAEEIQRIVTTSKL